MRLTKTFGLAALAAMTAMAFVGTTSASANKTTQLCNTHTGLTCSSAATSAHFTLAVGTVLKLLTEAFPILCLGVLMENSGADVGPLGNPQRFDTTSLVFSGCGTGAAHNDCTIAVEELPDNTLLKIGLDEGSLEAISGKWRLVCSSLGVDCRYDLEGSLFSVGAQHLTANEIPANELGGMLFCTLGGFLDALLETLESRYVLQ